MTVPQDRILHYRRQRALPDAGGHTLFCVVTYNGEFGRALGYPTPAKFPEFEGDEAWFRVRWTNRSRFEVIEQVADRSGAPLPVEA